ncbi:MAG: 3-dehydroquinate synthase [Phycisphaerae bacterium]|jgi:3-dehydroquinate synthase|nr:3-dehydroquinate synthase [Phycisphaerae bacterium]
MEQTIKVELGERSYDVRIGPGLLDSVGPTAVELGSVRQAVVIADSNIASRYGRRVATSLQTAGVATDMFEFPSGEANKTMASFSDLIDSVFTISPAVDRDLLIVACGGGVTGDITGYVAASVLRGVRWLQCPTSLLADVDASVGGKTGINHASGKNLIGAFHQPSGVLIDVDTLRTLPADDLRSGLGECVKHAVIRDATLLDFIADNTAAILAGEAGVMCDLIARNVAIKAAVVAGDERESGTRAHLNFGHTIGHAIETIVGYGTISHGAAVSLGMIAANAMAVARGLIDQGDALRVADALGALELPTAYSGLDPEQVWDVMQHDKKARAGRVRMVLPTEIGNVDIFDDITAREVAHAVSALE